MCSIVCSAFVLVARVFAVERDFSSCREQGLLPAAVRRLLCVVASPAAERGLSSVGLVAVGSSLLCGSWTFPGPGTELCSLQ